MMAVSEQHAFTVENSSTVNIIEQSDEVKADVDYALLSTLKHTDIKWQNGHGGASGHFPGLEERMTEKLEEGYVPKCDKMGECVLKLRVTTYGDVANTQVLVSCPAMNFATEADAQNQQAQCDETHTKVPEYVASTMHTRAMNIATLEARLDLAEAEVNMLRKSIQSNV
jgi:hypothetical protein